MMRRKFLAMALVSPFVSLIPKHKPIPGIPRAVIDNIPLLMRAFGVEDMQYAVLVGGKVFAPRHPVVWSDIPGVGWVEFMPTEARP